MVEYIKREDAIQCACELLIINGGCTRCSEGKKVCSSVREAFAIIPPADVVERTQWIPVSERLPNCNGCYLVWRPHFFGGEIGMPSICYFDGTNTWHDSYGVDFTRILHPEDVTHWMPLPEPPKEET